VAFNIVYNNGGSCIIGVGTSNYTIANNSMFNCYLDTDNTGTARGTNRDDYSDHVVLVNNISYAIIGSGVLSTNSPFLIGGTPSGTYYYNGGTGCGFVVDGVTDCGGRNIDYGRGYSGSLGGENPIYGTNPAWSCTANKCMSDPLWTNVGSTAGNTGSSGSMSVPPTGTNFALQSSSPAIGYGQTRPYLPAQSVDAGACYHTLTSCP
jgi:hypothetical protein